MASQTLKGEWLLVGGTLLPAVGVQVRTTVDIDFIPIDAREKNQNLELMHIAADLGLAIETINSAAEFYLKQISYNDSDLIPLLKGKRATIYRPSVSLYWQLKLKRLSEADLSDCIHYFQFCASVNDPINKNKMLQLLSGTERATNNPEVLSRIEKLRELTALVSA